MANEHIEIHDPFNGQNGISRRVDPVSNSENTEDMIEFRILMAYATRTRPKKTTESAEDSPDSPKDNKINGTPSIQTETVTEKKKKKKFWKRLPKVLTCLKPQTEDSTFTPHNDDGDDGVSFRTARGQKEEDLEDLTARLAEISDEILFVESELETDDPEGDPEDDDVEKTIGLILRDAGDQLNERELRNTNLTELLGDYNFFQSVMTTLLERMGLQLNTQNDPNVSTQKQIAVTCEATTRLSVLAPVLPMIPVLVFGARFLNAHFSSWAEQHGGYEKAFESEEDEDVQ